MGRFDPAATQREAVVAQSAAGLWVAHLHKWFHPIETRRDARWHHRCSV